MAKIPICPKCKSARVRQTSSVGGWLLPEQWTCEKCGYTGILIQEIDTEDVEKKKSKK